MAYNIPTRGGRGSGNAAPYVPALGDLVLSGALVAGVASSGTILNATPGSTITSAVTGLTINSGSRTYTYSGAGAAGSTNNGLTETLAGATFSPRGNVVTIVSGAIPAFTSNPSITPLGGNTGATYTGIDGAMNNGGSVLSRRWLLNGTSIGTGTTVVPVSAGSLVFENTGTGNVVASSAAVAITVAASDPTIAFANPTVSVTEGDNGTKTVSNTINVTRNGVTGALTINLTYGGTATSDADYVAGPVSLTLADSVSSGSFDLTINGDTTVEADETIIINAALSGYAATASKTITIGNDDVLGGTLTPYALSSETQSVGATSAYSTATPNRMNRLDRLARRLKAATKTINGAAVSMTNPAGKTIWQALRGLYIVGDTEGQWMTNLKSPGTNDLTKVGAPVFVAKEGVGGFSTTAYYDTGITLASMSATGASLGMQIAPTAVGGATGGESSNPDIGAYDGTAGLALWGLTTSTRIQARIFQTSASQAIGTTFFNGGGFMGAARRTANGAVHSTRHGVPLVAPTVSTAEVAGTFVPSTSTTTLGIGNVPGSAGASVRALSAVYFAEELTPDQETELTTAIQDYIYSVRWGDPFIYERGIGPANITADLVVYGLSQAALSAAYEAKRAGRTVALVGDWYDSQVWDVGGMPSNGLNWEDAKVFTKVGGAWRDMVSYANSIPGTTNVDTQAAQSPEPRYINAAARRMLDPARSGSLLPGMDIPVYMTGGITGVTKTGAALNTMITADGRTFTGKVFIDASYDGDLNYYSGAPVFTGREAAGPGLEAKNGFYTGTIETVTDNTTALALDPYVTPGNPASGLLPDIVDVSAKVSGAQDTAHQAMNNRLTVTTTRARYAPFDRVPPRNYTALRYELFGRQQAAATANGKTMGLTGFIAAQNLSSNGTVQDANNGSNALSTDLPQSGERYAAAGADKAARLAVFNDINDYGRGLIYYFTLSGDSRIQTSGGIKSGLDGLGLDPFAHLDPGANGATWWPNRPYTREPTFMLKNTGTIGSKPAVYDGNDIAATDGTTPRSTKTVTIANYRADVHALRRIAEGGVVKVQGGVQDNTGGGADNIAPIGMEYIMPDKSSVTNLLSPTAPSLTKTAYSVYRMEPTMAQAGQAAAQIAIAAIVNNVAVQDVDYGTDTTGVRGALLTNADVTRRVVLPQVN